MPIPSTYLHILQENLHVLYLHIYIYNDAV